MIYEMKNGKNVFLAHALKLFHHRYQHTNGQLNAPVFFPAINVVDFLQKGERKFFSVVCNLMKNLFSRELRDVWN
jgi:hypothetical protein